jgi:ceramide glucosyltransferase
MILANWAAGFCGVATACHLCGIAIAGARIGRQRPHRADSHQPPVTLLRPVCGIDNFAQETLASTFTIDYPDYEIIFCVADADDLVVPLVRELIAANPENGARLLIGDNRFCANPKLNNLLKGWQAARHQWTVIADSNVLLPPDYLHRLFAAWGPDTGAVCSMPVGARPHSFWAELECAFLNTLQARYQYVSEALGFGFAQGKTILLSRDIVERNGGFAALAIDDAEDAATTKLVRAAGLHVQLVATPFEQPLGWRSAGDVWRRQLRWARLRRASFPPLFLPELLVGALPPAVAFAFAASEYGFDVAAPVALFLILWFGAEWGLARTLGWPASWRLLPALILRDLILPALWIAALSGNQFTWRGNKMTTVNRDGSRRETAQPVVVTTAGGLGA